ncbi:MAG: class I SAM-dependent RNA methyltransferase [Burkholderiales bacterium]|nr:class I SAM-dependent RNA methyltransferase [Burkholderiales bacterium]
MSAPSTAIPDRRAGSPTGFHFFASCPRGLEPALAEELVELGLTDVEAGNAGVAFTGDWVACRRANLHSRIASRILWQVGRARYRDEDDVYRAAFELDWPQWFTVERTIRVHVSAIASPLKSLEFITLRIKDAVCDRFRDIDGRRPSVDTLQPRIRIHAFLTEGDVTLYLDSSGEALFKRGWRQRSVEAPLRENLAAGILRLAGWKPGTALLDPMCGSGTFLVEAAQIARGIPPGAGRRFGFENFLQHDAAAWQREREAVPPKDVESGLLFGSDLDPRAMKASRENLRDAGVGNVALVEQADCLVRDAPAAGGILIANPPYGVRIGEEAELAAFYPALGTALKRRFSGWNAYLFTADMRLPKLIGLKPSRRTPLFNGNLECRLYEFRMVAGSMRQRPAAEPESAP